MLLSILLALAASASDQFTGRTFQPVSTTATAITGPVRIGSDAVVFGKRSVPARRVASTAVGAVYRLARDPGPLLGGNFLCSRSEPARYLMVSEKAEPWGRTVTLAAFSGVKAPTDVDDPTLCATFSYE